MSTKSYSLADGTTVTVNATDNGIKFNEGMNILTKAIKAKIANSTKPTPDLSIGGWSAVDTVYVAPITYDGDGALSVNVGSISNGSLIVNDADGIFNGVLTASAGESYAQTNLAFTYNTDYVTIQGGGTASDNKLEQFFNTRNDYLIFSDDNVNRNWPGFSDGEYFLWGQTHVYVSNNDGVLTLWNSATDSIGIATDTATKSNYGTVVKLSETTGWVYYSSDMYNGTYQYQGSISILPFSINSSGSIVSGAVQGITSHAASSVAAHNHQRRITFARSCINPKSFNGIFYQKGNNNPVSYAYFWNINNRTGAFTQITALTMGTVYASPNGKQNLEFLDFAEQYPAVIQFNGEDVTLSKSSTPTTSPFMRYHYRTRNSSGNITTGADTIRLNAGGYPSPDSCVELSTITGGVQSKVNDWFEDDGYFIHGTYPNKARTDCYVVTYKPGTYSKDTYLQDAFKVWNVDFTTPRFVQSSKTLPQVLDDLAI